MSGGHAIESVYAAIIGRIHLIVVKRALRLATGGVTVFINQHEVDALFHHRPVVGVGDTTGNYGAAHEFEINRFNGFIHRQGDGSVGTEGRVAGYYKSRNHRSYAVLSRRQTR